MFLSCAGRHRGQRMLKPLMSTFIYDEMNFSGSEESSSYCIEGSYCSSLIVNYIQIKHINVMNQPQ